jgi:hypothetical protein
MQRSLGSSDTIDGKEKQIRLDVLADDDGKLVRDTLRWESIEKKKRRER